MDFNKHQGNNAQMINIAKNQTTVKKANNSIDLGSKSLQQNIPLNYK